MHNYQYRQLIPLQFRHLSIFGEPLLYRLVEVWFGKVFNHSASLKNAAKPEAPQQFCLLVPDMLFYWLQEAYTPHSLPNTVLCHSWASSLHPSKFKSWFYKVINPVLSVAGGKHITLVPVSEGCLSLAPLLLLLWLQPSALQYFWPFRSEE